MNRFIIKDDFEKELFHILNSAIVITVGLLSFSREALIVISPPPCMNVVLYCKAHIHLKSKKYSIVRV